jgi:large subunit ribosomal protein L15
VGFEGGQMPLQRRLPKRGFKSLSVGSTEQVRLSSLGGVEAEVIDILVLKQAGIVSATAVTAKVILKGQITRPLRLKGVLVTKGARSAIEAAGGTIEA